MATIRSGDAKWMSNLDDRRLAVQGHAHLRDHNTFAYSGWLALLVQDGPEAGRLVQLAHPDYRPPDDLVPIRYADVPGEYGPELCIGWAQAGPARLIEGGAPIPFAPDGYFYLVPAGVHHSIHTLSRQPALYLCWYTGRSYEPEIL